MLGLCVVCGRQRTSERKLCTECSERQRLRYAKARESGLCYCGKPRSTGKTRCNSCLSANHASAAKCRARKLASGKCGCGAQSRPNRQTCVKCAERTKSYSDRRVKSGLCKCGRAAPVNGKSLCQICRDHKSNMVRQRREQAIKGYGGVCVSCGESDCNVLQLDHVNNDGSTHRSEVGASSMYKWAIQNGYPDRLQLLCGNCHLAKTRTGSCAYRVAKESSQSEH